MNHDRAEPEPSGRWHRAVIEPESESGEGNTSDAVKILKGLVIFVVIVGAIIGIYCIAGCVSKVFKALGPALDSATKLATWAAHHWYLYPLFLLMSALSPLASKLIERLRTKLDERAEEGSDQTVADKLESLRNSDSEVDSIKADMFVEATVAVEGARVADSGLTPSASKETAEKAIDTAAAKIQDQAIAEQAANETKDAINENGEPEVPEPTVDPK